MSTTYARVAQLVPAGTYTTFELMASTILGSPVNGTADTVVLACGTDQTVLLWIAVVGCWLACFVASLLGDTVKYQTVVTSILGVTGQRLLPPGAVHAVLATSALAVLTLLDVTVFACLTGVILDAAVVRSVPIITGAFLVSVYAFLFQVVPAAIGTTNAESTGD